VHSLTIEGWIYLQDLNTIATLVDYSQPHGYTGTHISVNTTGSVAVRPGALYANLRDVNVGDHLLTTSDNVLTTNQWNHIALTYDQPTGVARLLVNGEVVALRDYPQIQLQTSLPLYLGYRPPGSVDYFGAPPFFGKMDEFSLYGRALAVAEVGAIFKAGANGKCFAPAIATSSLPEGQVGTAYSTELAAELGLAPYTYTLSAGSLPAGLSISTNGIIDGIPTAVGTSTFTIRVTDASGAFGSKDLTITVPTCVPLPESIVSWWPGNTNAHDVIGTNDIALHLGDIAPGKVGNAFVFDGLSSYGVTAASPSLNVSSFSMEAWINPSDVSVARPILEFSEKNGNAGVHFWLGVSGFAVQTPGALYANLRDAQLGFHLISTGPGVLAANQWTHAVLTFDQPSGHATIYVNGLAVVTTELGSFIPQTSFPLYLGIRPSTSRDYFGQPPFAGMLDEVTLYSRSLDAAEVAALFSAGAAGKCLDVPNIVVTNLNAVLGVAYSTQISARLGTAPYTFALAEGNLPSGLSLSTNGLLSGIPSAFGEFHFTVRATDTLNKTAFRELSFEVPNFAPTASSLVSWWPANGNGKDIADTNDLTLTGVAFASGESGSAFQFNGTTSYAVAAPAPSLNVSSLTLELWIYPADTNVRSPILEFSSPAGPLGVHLWLAVSSNGSPSPGALFVDFRDTLGGDHIMSSGASALRPNDWNHIAVTYDQPSGVASLFINGVSILTKTLGFFTPNTTLPLYFGARPLGNQFYDGTPPFAGRMDEISLYNRALSPAQIASIFNAGIAGKSPMTLWARDAGGSINLSWLSLATNSVLETSLELSTNGWQILLATPTLFRGDTRLRVTQPVTNTIQYFRLRTGN